MGEVEDETGMSYEEAVQYKEEQEEKFWNEIMGSREFLTNPEDVKELYGEMGADVNISSDYVFGYTGEICFRCKAGPGVTWRANFYKCADHTSHPHWLSWSVIGSGKFEFHVPEYFGTLEFK